MVTESRIGIASWLMASAVYGVAQAVVLFFLPWRSAREFRSEVARNRQERAPVNEAIDHRQIEARAFQFTHIEAGPIQLAELRQRIGVFDSKVQLYSRLRDVREGRWVIESIAWKRFDASKVDSNILRNVRAAAITRRSEADYNVRLFADDPAVAADVAAQANSEIRHSIALGKWVHLVDAEWDFDAAYARFQEGYKRLSRATGRPRGGNVGEMMRRCIEGAATIAYYGALRDSTEEPVLKEICAKIATDELYHYKLFYEHLRRYLKRDRLSRLTRLRIGWNRLAESENDELAYAYFAANEPRYADYDRKRSMRTFSSLAYPLYQSSHVEEATAMVLQTIGLNPQSFLNGMLTRSRLRFLRRHSGQVATGGI